MPIRISVTVITLNEAERLFATLDAVSWADEIIVLDSGSTDSTVEIARQFTEKVFVDANWQGFGVQKNRALALAKGEWVLSIDADEIVSPALAEEISLLMQRPAHDVYAIPRLSSFLGRPMRYGGWWPDYVPRLFRRGTARFSDDVVHERLLFSGQAGKLSAPLEHESIRSVSQMLEKLEHYSSSGALRLRRAGRKSIIWGAVGHGLWTFFRNYFIRLGFLDGARGFVAALWKAELSFYRHLKNALADVYVK